jgi:hypothetical protein
MTVLRDHHEGREHLLDLTLANGLLILAENHSELIRQTNRFQLPPCRLAYERILSLCFREHLYVPWLLKSESEASQNTPDGCRF